MALLHLLLVVGLVDATDELCESCGADSAFLQREISMERISMERISPQGSKYWYPTKSDDIHRSGESRATGMFPLPTTVAWEFTSPGHSAPVMDDKFNTYITSEEGKIFSFDQNGAMRWEANGTDKTCQNPVLYSGTLYTGCLDGSILALDMMTGDRLWQSKVCTELPYDVWTLGVTEDHIFMPLGAVQLKSYVGPFHEPLDIATPGVAMLSRVDGQVLWKFNLTEYHESQQELMPCMLSDSVVFTAQNGTIFRLGNEDGHVMWKARVPPNLFTVSQASCTEDGKVLVGLGSGVDGQEGGIGGVQALDIETGKHLWTIYLPHSTTTPIAVGQIQGHAGTALIVATGSASDFPRFTTLNHTLYAVDAGTGETIWTFDTPSATERGVRGSTLEHMCFPQSWSTPVISKDGTVYINWSYGGITYALRDTNKDGVCDPEDPEEVSSFDFGIGNYGGPVLAPGMLVVRTCHGPRALKVPEV